jgi:opacity protein-like surface antigen
MFLKTAAVALVATVLTVPAVVSAADDDSPPPAASASQGRSFESTVITAPVKSTPAPAPAPAPQPSAPAVAQPAAPVYGTAPGYAPQPPPPAYSKPIPRQEDPRDRDGRFGFGAGWYGLNVKDDGSTDKWNFYGATLGGGFEFAKSSIGQVRFHFDLGCYVHTADVTESYSGYYSYVRSEERTAVAVPVLFSPTYEFNLGTPKARLRLGATIGATWLLINSDLSDSSYYYGSYYKLSDNALLLSYGGVVGFTYTPSKSFYMDLGYRYVANSKGKFTWNDGDTVTLKSTAHLVEFTIGWRF